MSVIDEKTVLRIFKSLLLYSWADIDNFKELTQREQEIIGDETTFHFLMHWSLSGDA